MNCFLLFLQWQVQQLDDNWFYNFSWKPYNININSRIYLPNRLSHKDRTAGSSFSSSWASPPAWAPQPVAVSVIHSDRSTVAMSSWSSAPYHFPDVWRNAPSPWPAVRPSGRTVSSRVGPFAPDVRRIHRSLCCGPIYIYIYIYICSYDETIDGIEGKSALKKNVI